MIKTYNASKLSEMTVMDMVAALKEIGSEEINLAMEWIIDEMKSQPFLILKSDYSVTFQDPTKPAATVFKRHECFKGDQFYLRGSRSTSKNSVILLFDLGPNVKKNMARMKRGPGLAVEWSTAEFTLNLIKNDVRLNSSEFLESALYAHHVFHTQARKTDVMYDGAMAGSW